MNCHHLQIAVKEDRQPPNIAELVFAEQKQVVLLATQASDLGELKNFVDHLRLVSVDTHVDLSFSSSFDSKRLDEAHPNEG